MFIYTFYDFRYLFGVIRVVHSLVRNDMEGGVMVFNATFNNISVISWRSVLLVEELEYPEITIDLPQVNDKFIT